MIGCLPMQALAFLAVFVYATHATQAIAFEWKPGFSIVAAAATVALCRIISVRVGNRTGTKSFHKRNQIFKPNKPNKTQNKFSDHVCNSRKCR